MTAVNTLPDIAASQPPAAYKGSWWRTWIPLTTAVLSLAAGITFLVMSTRASSKAHLLAATICGRNYPLADRAPDTPLSVIVLAITACAFLMLATASLIWAVIHTKKQIIKILVASALAPVLALTLLCGVGDVVLRVNNRQGAVCHHGG